MKKQVQFRATGAQFSKIVRPRLSGTRGREQVDDRRVVSGIVQVLKSGGRSIDGPLDYRPRKTVHYRYVRCAVEGVCLSLFHAHAQGDHSPSQALIEASAVKAHHWAAGERQQSAR